VDAVAAGEIRRIAEEGVALSGRMAHAVARQLDEGEASQLDLRLARLAEVRAASRLLEARADEVAALRALAEQTGLPTVSSQLTNDPLAAAPSPGSTELKEDRSDLRAAMHALDAAEAGLQRARAATFLTV